MIVLTGASGGIGNLLLKDLSNIDRVIALHKRKLNNNNKYKNVTYVKLDLEDKNQIESFVNNYSKEFKKITVIHCAVIKKDNLTINYNIDDWEKSILVNLRANFILTKKLLNYMIKEKWGRIIHFASKDAIKGEQGTIAYSTSKSGLIGMSRVLSKEYAMFNITSNVLSLGAFNTGLYSSLDEKIKKKIINKIPSKKIGDVSNIFNAIKFIIESDYVNGSVINIDGGT